MIVGLGQIPLVKYGTPGTPELSAAIEPYVPHYDALLLANHGAVTCGPDLLTAFFRMETIEHFAKITLAAEMAGNAYTAVQPRSREVDGRADAVFCGAAPGGGAELPVTSDSGDSRRRPRAPDPQRTRRTDRRSGPQRPFPPIVPAKFHG